MVETIATNVLSVSLVISQCFWETQPRTFLVGNCLGVFHIFNSTCS